MNQLNADTEGAPRSSHVALGRLLAWIAFGNVRAPVHELEFSGRAFPAPWTHPADLTGALRRPWWPLLDVRGVVPFTATEDEARILLHLLQCRTAEYPSCPVSLRNPNEACRLPPDAPPSMRRYARHPFSPHGPSTLRLLRACARRAQGRLVSYGEMRDALQEALERVGHARAGLEAAKTEVVAAMAGGRLTGWSTRADRGGAGRREAIPVHVLSEPELELTSTGRLGAPLWRGGAVYSAVTFLTAEVLALWPSGPTALERARVVGNPADRALTAAGGEASGGAHGEQRGTRAEPRRKPRGFDYRASDAPLVERMRGMVGRGEAKDAWDAALQLAGSAAGHGEVESKAKRLHKRYSEHVRSCSAAERDGTD